MFRRLRTNIGRIGSRIRRSPTPPRYLGTTEFWNEAVSAEHAWTDILYYPQLGGQTPLFASIDLQSLFKKRCNKFCLSIAGGRNLLVTHFERPRQRCRGSPEWGCAGPAYLVTPLRRWS